MNSNNEFWLKTLINSKRLQRSRTVAVPSAGPKASAAPVISVEVETPTYLEVPDFQRVAVIGDYAAGVLLIFLHDWIEF